MPVTPAGSLSKTLLHFKNLIAASTTFQSVVGADDATEALAFILEFWADEKDEDEQIPNAVIRHLGGLEANRTSTTGWLYTGPILMLFTFPATGDYADKSEFRNAGIDFTNKVGAILDEMKTLVATDPGAGPYLNITSIELVELGQMDPKETNGIHAWAADFIVNHEGL